MAEVLSTADETDGGDEEYEIEQELKVFVDAAVDAEVVRAEGLGQRTIRLTAKNCGVVFRDGGVTNRVEVDTGFNFDTVQEILLSPAVAIPCKRGYALRFVVLSTGKPVVLLLPYVYQIDVEGNTLQKWEFINKSLMSSHHTVEAELAA